MSNMETAAAAANKAKAKARHCDCEDPPTLLGTRDCKENVETDAAAAAAAAKTKAQRCGCGCGCEDDPPALLGMKELRTWCLYRAAIAEFTATLIFLYVSIATVIGSKKQQQQQQSSCAGVGSLGVAWSFGATIFVLVYCTKGVSGGHVNPAVTFGMLLGRKVSLLRALLYVLAQCLGAVCGAGVVMGVMGQPAYSYLGDGANVVAQGYSLGGALGAEIVGTFVLVYTVFSAVDPINKRTGTARDCCIPVLLPLPIGFAVFVVHLATIPITGTGINPARSLGAALIYNHHAAWKDHWIFWVGPLIGAATAAFYHKLVLRGDEALRSLMSLPAPARRRDH
ncbi:hypothetical protein U9M48_030055 [Paspalum notatum var. saurae]|uniref:Uncharacterized protein n=1 Tax=Paspalum notatum var. saurae TaxID=547442 RepID=A0AAQ3X290_PASNO